MTARIGLLIYWFMLAIILFVIVPLGVFVAPSMVAGWKAQGLREAPIGWQIIVDLADFFVHRWFVWLPAYIALGVWLKSAAKRASS